MSKICKYWTHYGQQAHHKITKPIRPTFVVTRPDSIGYDPEKGKVKADLYCYVPFWYAEFATKEFPDRDSLC